jgi:hypothetical protein
MTQSCPCPALAAATTRVDRHCGKTKTTARETRVENDLASGIVRAGWLLCFRCERERSRAREKGDTHHHQHRRHHPAESSLDQRPALPFIIYFVTIIWQRRYDINNLRIVRFSLSSSSPSLPSPSLPSDPIPLPDCPELDSTACTSFHTRRSRICHSPFHRRLSTQRPYDTMQLASHHPNITIPAKRSIPIQYTLSLPSSRPLPLNRPPHHLESPILSLSRLLNRLFWSVFSICFFCFAERPVFEPFLFIPFYNLPSHPLCSSLLACTLVSFDTIPLE